MATYKKPCIHCGKLIDSGTRVCPYCGAVGPFGYSCPSCLIAVEKDMRVCPSCGRPLYVTCPHCGGMTFAGPRCDQCGQWLMVRCENKRCGELQFFDLERCTACGKKIKKR